MDATFPTEATAPTNETHHRVRGLTATLRVPNLEAEAFAEFVEATNE